MKKKYTVMVAEDEELLLNSFCRKFTELDDEFVIIGTARNGKELYEKIQDNQPDVLFTDIQMPLMNGLQLLKSLHKKYPNMVKVVISGYDKFDYVQTALRLNVTDYLLKPVVKSEMKEVLVRVKKIIDTQNTNLPYGNIHKGELSIEKVVVDVRDIILANYKTEIDFAQLSEQYHYNEVHLSRAFKNIIGMSPTKYVNTLRIDEAKYLLKNNKEMSVGEIGIILGYSTPMYFSRVFKSHIGKTPGEYRNDEEKQ